MTRVQHRHLRDNGELDENANQDIEDALKYLRDAENLIRPDNPIQSGIQNEIALAYWYKGGTENQQIAFTLLERAVIHNIETPWRCFNVAWS